MLVQSVIINEISVNLVDFLAKSDTPVLNAHVVVSKLFEKYTNMWFYMAFLIHSHNVMKNARSKCDH